MSTSSGRFNGKYRGKVTNNSDPKNKGRIKVKVPAVLADKELGWALACTPYGGPGVGFFFIPPINANVWVEFENGDPEAPIWTGCFWNPDDSNDNPPGSGTPDSKVIKTDVATITIKDTKGQGGITIETTGGMKIVMDSSGIELNNNGSMKIKITQASVSVNDGDLEVV